MVDPVAPGPEKTKAPLWGALEDMAEWTGLEPATSGVTGQHSNRLNYHSAELAMISGRKNSRKLFCSRERGWPTSWPPARRFHLHAAGVLVVGTEGIEPPTRSV